MKGREMGRFRKGGERCSLNLYCRLDFKYSGTIIIKPFFQTEALFLIIN